MDRRLFLASAAAGVAAAPCRGAIDWPGIEPRQAGFDEAKLDACRADLAARNTKAFLILRKGRKVLEWYAPGSGPATRHYTASLAKALVGGTSLLVAMSDHRIRPNDLAARYIPAWSSDPLKSKIAIRHLATHTSGIEDSSVDGIAHGKEPGWKGAFWRREPNPFHPSIQQAPVLFEPGTSSHYSNPGIAALGYAVTASLRGAPQTDILTLLRDRVLNPLGIPKEEWSIGYGSPYVMDGLNLYATWGGGSFTPRATARIGEWMMQGGRWDGKALVGAAAAQQMARYAGMPLPGREKSPHAPGSGLCWYSNFDGVWPAAPRDAFAGAGAQQQIMLVVPSLQLVVVRNGGDLRPDPAAEEGWTAINRLIFDPVMAAMGNPVRPLSPPYPKSTAIRSVSFAPADKIARLAPDCDNWPLTWGDDDALYVSYGDGHGFEPFVPEKLSMGFARVDGGPGNFRGTNIRSATGERKGDGKAGAKGSGMVMVEGVLYQWVRNTGNAQISWSEDRARTWNWGFKFEKSFGSPAFVNFGRNYSGAADDYVYSYSQDGGSAYEVDDAIVLARVTRDRIREKDAWQFFMGMVQSRPRWTRDIDGRQPVFRFARHCQRVDAAYHPVLKRYLLLVGYGHSGGWGIYEAPQPWGPWATAFHTEYWGLGETHGYRLPTKWISRDGHDAALVFSGLIYGGVTYDAFCVRGMRFDF